MQEIQNKHQETIYVCVNHKEGKECCGGRGSEEIKDKLKSESKKRFGDQVKVVATKCQGYCHQGPTVFLGTSKKRFIDFKLKDIEPFLDTLSMH